MALAVANASFVPLRHSILKLYTHIASDESRRAMERLTSVTAGELPQEVRDAVSAQIQHNGENGEDGQRAN